MNRAFVAIVLLVTIWLAPPALVWFLVRDWDTAGKIGDSFAIATSFFSGLALLGAIYTIWQQHRDAQERQAQTAAQMRATLDQIAHLSLSTRLASARAMMDENRKAIAELDPTISAVPSVPDLLKSLKQEIAAKANLKLISEPKASEITSRLDDLIALHREIYDIRSQLSVLRQ